MSTDLLVQIVTTFPPDLKANSLQAACMSCSDGTLFLGEDISFLRTSASAKKRAYMALYNLLPKRVAPETFLLIVPRFIETDVTSVHDELLRLMLRLTGYTLTITGYLFTDLTNTEAIFEQEAIGLLARSSLTRSAAEAAVKAVRKFTADRVETYALQLELSVDGADVAPMKIHLLSPFVGRASNTAPISAPGWLSIFCDYHPLKGSSDHNTVVLKYLDPRVRKANMSRYFSASQSSTACKNMQNYLSSLIEAQELGAKTLTILTVINPELHKKQSVQGVLHAIAKDTLFPIPVMNPETETDPLEKEEKSIHICDSSIDSSQAHDDHRKLFEPTTDDLIKHLQQKLDAATHDQLILSKMLMKEQCIRRNLEERLAKLTDELTRAQEDTENERRRVTYLLKKLHEGPAENERQTLQGLNEECSPVTTITNLLPPTKEIKVEDTLDEFLCTLPTGKDTGDTSIVWDKIVEELGEVRCSSGLQAVRMTTVGREDGAKHETEHEAKQMQYLEYENKILELQQKLLESDIKLSKVREQIQDEYDAKLRNETYRIKAEVEQDFEERLRNLNPKAWYEYIKKNQQE